MEYRQSLGSSISGRCRQQRSIKVKKHHDITKQSKRNTSKNIFTNSRRLFTFSREKEEPLIEMNKNHQPTHQNEIFHGLSSISWFIQFRQRQTKASDQKEKHQDTAKQSKVNNRRELLEIIYI